MRFMSHRPRKARVAPPTASPPRRARWLPWLLGAGIAALVGVVVWLKVQIGRQEGQPPPPEDPLTVEAKDYPPPPYSASRYLNTGPEAHSIGSAACAAC